MTTPAAAALLNLLGHITGAALYAMLLVMTLGPARRRRGQPIANAT